MIRIYPNIIIDIIVNQSESLLFFWKLDQKHGVETLEV